MEQISQIQLLYEIAMSIGTSLDMKRMLRGSLQVYLRKLGCFSGAIIRSYEDQQEDLKFETVFSIPRRLESQLVKHSALTSTSFENSTVPLSVFRDQLPMVWNEQDKYFHLMALPGFGLLYLAKSGKPLGKPIIKSLKPLNAKLAYSCLACLQNTKVEELVQERTAQLSRLNDELLAEIAERARTESELKKAKRLADQASQAKSDFVANMSHEIRTPLNGVLGIAEMMGDLKMPETQRNLLNIISGEAESVLWIINDILDFSKIEAGSVELEERPLDLRKMLDGLATNLTFQAEQKGLALVTYIPPDLDTRRICDPVRIRQIMVNLISNAIKFTNRGEVFVTIDSAEETDNPEMIRFRVIDSGIGIPKEKHAKIFESFTQADSSTTRKYGGTGLGTAISKKLVELMGGEIGVESIPNFGSTFWFTLNLAKQEVHSKSKPVRASYGLKVLVVDTNRRSRFVLEKYLKSMGCFPTILSDPGEALPENVNVPFDLILIDEVIAPQEDGDKDDFFMMGQRLDCPWITMGSAGVKYKSNETFKKPFAGHLLKPVKKVELERLLHSIAEQKSGNSPESLVAALPQGRDAFSEVDRKDIRLLLAEDYPTNQKVAMAHLDRAGYSVDLVENGLQAYEAFTSKTYDCILLDIQMPEMDGYECAQKIRAFEKTSGAQGGADTNKTRVPIIAMTAHAFKECRDACHAVGMDNFITKPLKRKDLLSMVEKYTAKDPSQSIKLPVQHGDLATSNEQRPTDDVPIDLAGALLEFLGDSELLKEVLDEFLIIAEKQIHLLQQAVDKQDANKLYLESHSIKGGAANLLAGKLAGLASELESAGKMGDFTVAPDILTRLAAEFSTLKNYLSKTDISTT